MTQNNTDQSDLDYSSGWGDDGLIWEDTIEHYRCKDCGHVGPAEAEVQYEIQGEGGMSGGIYIDTGDYRCKECDSRNLEEVE